MDKLEQRITMMQGILNCLQAQGKINDKLLALMSASLGMIYQASQAYTKPKSKATFSEVEEYVNKHINMADTEVLEAEIERRKEVANSLK